MAAAADGYTFETLAVSTPQENVYHVQLNRPDKLNAMNNTMWREIGQCFDKLGEDSDCRAIVLSGNGRLFTSGLDLSDMSGIVSVVMGDDDVARKCRLLHHLIKEFQDSFTALEKCPKPVIAAIHSACVGGGVDLICAADIRYCASDAWFQVKEVELGLAADVGTLQRLPKIIGNQSLVRELAFSARKVFSGEALQCGLVSRVFSDKESVLNGALDMATTIASMSPVAVQNTKTTLIHARDHTVQEGLDYVATLNMTMLQSEDLRIAAMAMMNKGKKPTFAKL
ncbi:delta(3,5)-Delta(2,4)-dienoyl-CoA isomerase, mitochondrial-like isoform X2 [Penaeus japonicus]|nr:delta(3,5)-Delta(2,4)-dienoyl-CoA isomerase, mitochondrial-like isoform X2 [Penaeus japonicus]